MHVIVRQGNGKFYVSAAFGYYCEEKTKEYLPNHTAYYIVWDETGKRLIKEYEWENSKYLIFKVFIIETSKDDWVVSEGKYGGVDFLPESLANQIIETGVFPEGIYEKCKALDLAYEYQTETPILTDRDIENFEEATHGLHDAFLKECRFLEDGRLYVKFTGAWTGQVNLWFSGDVEYDITDTERRKRNREDWEWNSSTVLLQDDYVYLIDEYDMTLDRLEPGYNWFKARSVKYQVIPY